MKVHIMLFNRCGQIRDGLPLKGGTALDFSK